LSGLRAQLGLSGFRTEKGNQPIAGASGSCYIHTDCYCRPACISLPAFPGENRMFTLWGAKHRFCDTFNRRGFLRAGALGSLGLPDGLRLQAQAATDRKTAKSVIFVCLAGGPSHIDMYDLKPDAPVDVRGEFKPIQSNVPGFDICEHFPLQSRIADKMALVRTLQFVEPMQHELEEVYSGYIKAQGRPSF